MFGYNALLAEQLQTPSETQVASILWSLGFARLQQMAHKFNCHKMKKKVKAKTKNKRQNLYKRRARCFAKRMNTGYHQIAPPLVFPHPVSSWTLQNPAHFDP